MTTAVALRHPKIRPYAQSLTPQERFKHRAWIGVRIEALMDPYWQTRPSEAAKEMILADWMSALENYDPQEIDFACKAYLSGADCKSKPKPGDILRIMVAERGKLLAALPKPEPFQNVQPPAAERIEAAKRIMADVFKSSPLKGDA